MSFFIEILGAGIDQNELGSDASGKRALPVAAKASNSVS